MRVGQLSYGLYLWHIVAAAMVWDGIVSGNPALVAVSTIGAVGLSFGLALISERWIEGPFRRARRRAPRFEVAPVATPS